MASDTGASGGCSMYVRLRPGPYANQPQASTRPSAEEPKTTCQASAYGAEEMGVALSAQRVDVSRPLSTTVTKPPEVKPCRTDAFVMTLSMAGFARGATSVSGMGAAGHVAAANAAACELTAPVVIVAFETKKSGSRTAVGEQPPVEFRGRSQYAALTLDVGGHTPLPSTGASVISTQPADAEKPACGDDTVSTNAAASGGDVLVLNGAGDKFEIQTAESVATSSRPSTPFPC